MDDQRQTQRAEGTAGELRPFFRGDGGQRGAVDDGNIHPALLNHRAVFQHHRHAVAAQAAVRTIALPNVAPERLAVFRRQGVRNAALQLIKKAGESVDLCWRNAHGISGE